MTGPVGYDVVVQLFYGGAWHVVDPARLHEAVPVTTYRGYAEEGMLRPCEIRLRILDDALDYDPDNPRSPLYGLIGRRTPITVTVQGAADAAGEVASWRPGMTTDWDPGPPVRGYRYVDVVASGLLRRVGNWSRSVQSPMRRQLASYVTAVGYWPLEDAKSTNAGLSNLVAGGQAGAVDGVNLSGATPPGGSAPLGAFTSTGNAYGVFGVTGTSAWQVGVALDLSGVTLPAAPGQARPFAVNTGLGLRFAMQANLDGFGLLVTGPDSTALYTNAVTWAGAGVAADRWMWFRIAATHTGSLVSLTYSAHTEGYSYTFSRAGSFTASGLGRLGQWSLAADGLGAGHIIGLQGVSEDIIGAQLRTAFNGHLGEFALDRFGRLCAQEGVPAVTVGDPLRSQRMGGQGADALVDLLKQTAATEDAFLYEDRVANQVVMRARHTLYAEPLLALSYPDEIAPPFLPVTDDLQVANTVTVKHVDGAQATARAAAGPLDPAEVGEERQEVYVNTLNEDDVVPLAGYYLNRYSLGGARYPSVVVDADANPVAAAAAAALSPGDRIVVTGYRPDPIGLMVLGVATSTGTHRRTVSLTTMDDAAFRAGRYDDPGSRYDVASTTITAPLLAGAAPGSVAVVAVSTAQWNTGWSTLAVPYDWVCGVERLRVTAMSVPAGTGSDPRTQTATVVRGVNEVVTAHPAGSPVRLADPVRWGR